MKLLTGKNIAGNRTYKSNRLKIVIVLSLLLPAATSCGVFDTHLSEHPLTGQWEWVRSTGGFVVITLTPDSPEQSNRTLSFSSIDNAFTLQRADTLVTSGTYTLKEDEDGTLIHYETANKVYMVEQRIKFKGTDTLNLLDVCNDCYNHIYVRH